jgi:hypothetical protein
VENLRPARAPAAVVRDYLLPLLGLLGLLGLFGVVEELPLLVPPLAPPLGVFADELPLAAEPLLAPLEPPADDWSRWQPASASASDAAMIIRTFMRPPLEKGKLPPSKHRAVVASAP